MIALPDANVLVALVWAQHVHHHAAHAWFSRSTKDGWATCLLTQSAFLRLSMNPHVVHVAVDCAAARALLVGIVAHPNHVFIADSPALSSNAFDPIAALVGGYRQMSDATLLLIARAHGLKLVTFDQAVSAFNPWPTNVETLMP